jgi:hypothetical protein
MAKLLFKLRGVPDDEADEVRQLLEAHGMPVYETTAGTWGTGVPAIWLQDESRLDAARALLDGYQRERAQRMRSDYAEQKRRGEHRRMRDLFRERPLQFIAAILATIAVIYISVWLVREIANRIAGQG